MPQFRIWDLHGQRRLPVRAELPPPAVRSWDEAKWVRGGFEVREKRGNGSAAWCEERERSQERSQGGILNGKHPGSAQLPPEAGAGS